MTHKAYDELQRVRNLPAFNILGAIRKRRINQFATEYVFDDSSVLKLYSCGRAQTWSNASSACDCVSELRANKRGN